MQLLQLLYTFLRRIFQLLLRVGPVPRHVAFIMDGNRRFAQQAHIDKISGHREGYKKMVDVIHWCLELGVKYISVYAFSLDNFQRSADEVGSLMHLAEAKYQELAQDHGLAEREGIEMRVVGDLSVPPPGVQGAAARLMLNTSKIKNKRALLNICFSYSATEDLVHCVDTVQRGIRSGALQPGDVDEQLLASCSRTAPCPDIDLLIRTSGETRLSDFMLWQVVHAHLCFVDVLWPAFSFLDFAQCILQYQWHRVGQDTPKDKSDRGQRRTHGDTASTACAAAPSRAADATGAGREPEPVMQPGSVSRVVRRRAAVAAATAGHAGEQLHHTSATGRAASGSSVSDKSSGTCGVDVTKGPRIRNSSGSQSIMQDKGDSCNRSCSSGAATSATPLGSSPGSAGEDCACKGSVGEGCGVGAACTCSACISGREGSLSHVSGLQCSPAPGAHAQDAISNASSQWMGTPEGSGSGLLEGRTERVAKFLAALAEERTEWIKAHAHLT